MCGRKTFEEVLEEVIECARCYTCGYDCVDCVCETCVGCTEFVLFPEDFVDQCEVCGSFFAANCDHCECDCTPPLTLLPTACFKRLQKL